MRGNALQTSLKKQKFMSIFNDTVAGGFHDYTLNLMFKYGLNLIRMEEELKNFGTISDGLINESGYLISLLEKDPDIVEIYGDEELECDDNFGYNCKKVAWSRGV